MNKYKIGATLIFGATVLATVINIVETGQRVKKQKARFENHDNMLKIIDEVNNEMLDLLLKMDRDRMGTHISEEELDELRVTKLKEFYGRTEDI